MILWPSYLSDLSLESVYQTHRLVIYYNLTLTLKILAFTAPDAIFLIKFESLKTRTVEYEKSI